MAPNTDCALKEPAMVAPVVDIHKDYKQLVSPAYSTERLINAATSALSSAG